MYGSYTSTSAQIPAVIIHHCGTAAAVPCCASETLTFVLYMSQIPAVKLGQDEMLSTEYVACEQLHPKPITLTHFLLIVRPTKGQENFQSHQSKQQIFM